MLAEKLLVMAGRAGKYKSVVMGCRPSSMAKMTTTSPADIGVLAFWEVVAGLGKVGVDTGMFQAYQKHFCAWNIRSI